MNGESIKEVSNGFFYLLICRFPLIIITSTGFLNLEMNRLTHKYDTFYLLHYVTANVC